MNEKQIVQVCQMAKACADAIQAEVTRVASAPDLRRVRFSADRLAEYAQRLKTEFRVEG